MKVPVVQKVDILGYPPDYVPIIDSLTIDDQTIDQSRISLSQTNAVVSIAAHPSLFDPNHQTSTIIAWKHYECVSGFANFVLFKKKKNILLVLHDPATGGQNPTNRSYFHKNKILYAKLWNTRTSVCSALF